MAQATHTPITLKAPDFRRSHGRGSQSNVSGRYESERRTLDDEVLGDAEAPKLRTEVTEERAKQIITTNQSPDLSFDQSINPYRGCEHGCVYCFARPTHAFMNLSPGLDFESRLFAKPNAAQILRKELSEKRYVPKVIAMGTNTDPYQPIERDRKITRSILEVLHDFNHPVAIVTKSDLILRDLDILAPMALKGLAKVGVSVTTLNPKLARAMEPRAPGPKKRLTAIRKLSEAGVPVAVMAAPIIPALNDAEIETILEAAKDRGACQAAYIMLRLPMEIKHLFREWLEAIVPHRADHIMRVVREMRGGKDYEAGWFVRQRGRGAYAQMTSQRFRKAVDRLGLNRNSYTLDTSRFKRPLERGNQLALF